MVVIVPKLHQPGLAPFIRDELLTRETLDKVRGLLLRNHAFSWMDGTGQADISTSLFPASPPKKTNSGLQPPNNAPFGTTVWVRDNMFLAFALHETDEDGESTSQAINIVSEAAKFFLKTASRFDDVIAGHSDPRDPMCRPHVCFDGDRLEENADYWNHSQNDALGYFMWMRCRLCVDGKMPMSGDHLRLLGLMLEYLIKIEYWQDEDCGPWEEEARIGASSIGPVVAAAQEFQKLLAKYPGMMVPCRDGTLDAIEQHGREALNAILPKECAQAGKKRELDAALLFLIYPLRMVEGDLARAIVGSIQEQLVGPIGVRRFNGDSYWCKDFKQSFGGKGVWKSFTAQELADRNKLVVPGEEAQWCLFDPILSAIYGIWYQETREFNDLLQQQQYLFRSVGHISGPSCSAGQWQCPESYYLSCGSWVPSETCPHMWTQANLHMALVSMDKSLVLSQSEIKAEFNKFDVGGVGTIGLDDLVAVLTKLNDNLPAKEVAELLGDFAQDGVVSFESLVDGLFSGNKKDELRSSFMLHGLRPVQDMSADELHEVERVVTEALLGFTGDFEGEYFPLPASNTFPARVGGMSQQEADALSSRGMLFFAGEASGRGVFANSARDIGVLVNSGCHVQLVIRPPLGDTETGEARMRSLEKVLRDALRLSGQELLLQQPPLR